MNVQPPPSGYMGINPPGGDIAEPTLSKVKQLPHDPAIARVVSEFLPDVLGLEVARFVGIESDQEDPLDHEPNAWGEHAPNAGKDPHPGPEQWDERGLPEAPGVPEAPGAPDERG